MNVLCFSLFNGIRALIEWGELSLNALLCIREGVSLEQNSVPDKIFDVFATLIVALFLFF